MMRWDRYRDPERPRPGAQDGSEDLGLRAVAQVPRRMRPRLSRARRPTARSLAPLRVLQAGARGARGGDSAFRRTPARVEMQRAVDLEPQKYRVTTDRRRRPLPKATLRRSSKVAQGLALHGV